MKAIGGACILLSCLRIGTAQQIDSWPAGGEVLGVDRRGIPLVCGTLPMAARVAADTNAVSLGDALILPATTRMWEAVPGVIRTDGIDRFRLEVNVNGVVSNVVLNVWPAVLSESGAIDLNLRDDGTQGDRVAGDRIHTSEFLRFNTNNPGVYLPYAGDTNSPAGVGIKDIGTLRITETNGQQTFFLHEPQIGLLSWEIPPVERIALSSNVVISPHVINVRGTNLSVQRFIRGFTLGTSELTKQAYAVFPDAFDFLIHFSTYRLERTPYNSTANFNVGVQWPVQVNFTGTGQSLFNNGATYGSAGRLLALIGLDGYERGIWSQNCTHELVHQWASFINAFPISDGQHYISRSSVGSLLGGHLWQTNGTGFWTLICEEGRNGATHLDPLDKYLMGLVSTSAVPVLRTYSSSDPLPLFMCNGTISNIASTVTIQNIVNSYGLRSPGPATAQRNFSLGFIAESCERILNSTEMTFYDILAAHYTTNLPPGYADPYVGWNWAPITQFFGEGTTWRSDVLDLIRPVMISVQRLPGGTNRIVGSGYPGQTYVLHSSTNLSHWTSHGSQSAAGDKSLVFLDTSVPQAPAKFYRLRRQ